MKKPKYTYTLIYINILAPPPPPQFLWHFENVGPLKIVKNRGPTF